jgi:hypothetical protein
MTKYFSTTSRSRMFRFIWNVIGANIWLLGWQSTEVNIVSRNTSNIT